MAKSAVIHIRLDPDLLEQIRKRAEKDGRTTSDWAARALAAAVKRPTLKVV